MLRGKHRLCPFQLAQAGSRRIDKGHRGLYKGLQGEHKPDSLTIEETHPTQAA